VPRSLRSLTPDVCSTDNPTRLRKLAASLAYRLCLVVLTFAAGNRGYAQRAVQALHNHLRPAVSDGRAPVVGSLPPEQQLNLSIVLPLRHQDVLNSLLGRLYDPSSADYRRFLSVAEFTDQFGPAVDDYQAIVSFAH